MRELPLDLRTRTEPSLPLSDSVNATTTVPVAAIRLGRDRANARAILRAKMRSAPLLADVTLCCTAAQYDVAPIWKGVWGVDGQYDFVRAKFEGDNVPRIPPHRLGGGLYYRDANLFVRVGVLHAFEQDDVNAESNEATTPGYTLVNAELSYTTKLSTPVSGPSTELTIGIKGENLADEEVLNHSSFKRREDVLLPGASVKVFGKLKFN